MTCQNSVADKLGNLRDYSVPEGLKSVHPSGNPMSHSIHGGFSGPPIAVDRAVPPCGYFARRQPVSSDTGVGTRKFTGERPADRNAIALVLLATGVGNKPYSISDMRGTNGVSAKAEPLRIIPERGQVAEYNSKPPTKQCCDVLHDDVEGSNFANETAVFAPQPRLCAGDAFSAPSEANILTWEAAADCVNGNSIGSKSLCGKLADVMIAGHLWPMFRQHAAGEFLNFAERDGLEPARALQAERETADAAEQVEKLELLHLPLHPKRARDVTVGVVKLAPVVGTEAGRGACRRNRETEGFGIDAILPAHTASPVMGEGADGASGSGIQ